MATPMTKDTGATCPILERILGVTPPGTSPALMKQYQTRVLQTIMDYFSSGNEDVMVLFQGGVLATNIERSLSGLAVFCTRVVDKVCMYVCVCICTYLHTYVCVCVHMYVSTYVCVCVHTYVRTCVCVHMYVSTYVCVCVHTYVCMYVCVHMYVCMHVCTHTYMCEYVCTYVGCMCV